MLQIFADDVSLPALQLNINGMSSSQESITRRRTIFVDHCQFSVQLTNIKSNIFIDDIYNIYLILIDKYDDNIKHINNILEKLDKYSTESVYILVRINNEYNVNNINNTKRFPRVKKHKNIEIIEEKQLCKQYNIACIEVSLDSEDSMHSLFTFAIKYYWFKMVNKSQINNY